MDKMVRSRVLGILETLIYIIFLLRTGLKATQFYLVMYHRIHAHNFFTNSLQGALLAKFHGAIME